MLTQMFSGRVDQGTAAGLVTASGRKIYRHESDMGSVLEFNDGQPRKVLVLDAAYRTNKAFGAAGVNASLPDVQGDFVEFRHANEITTDEFFNTGKGPIDPNTAKQNCDVWMTYAETTNGSVKGVPAVEYCRSISVVDNGVQKSCDLPNIQTLARIAVEAEFIDSLDPTIVEYPRYALSEKNAPHKSRMSMDGFCWAVSSSEGANAKIWYTYYGYSFSNQQPRNENTLGVIPVLEI